MSNAEKFISEHTRKLTQYGDDYFLWVTPDDARKAVEIAKEEVIEKTLDFLKDKLYENGYVGIIDLCDDYIKTMKNE